VVKSAESLHISLKFLTTRQHRLAVNDVLALVVLL